MCKSMLLGTFPGVRDDENELSNEVSFDELDDDELDDDHHDD